jgi:glycerophosphoryl diester phosphodiesterase
MTGDVQAPTVPAVIAHRGASAAHPPGNTVEAFAAAGPLGATGVELDVRRCADGTLAVHHDEHLPDGRALVGLRGDELPPWVPTLEAALEACAGLLVNIEIKNHPRDGDFDPDESLAAAVVALVAGRGDRADQTLLVSSFHRPTIDRVRSLAPALPTAMLHNTLDEARLAVIAEGGHRAVHPRRGTVTAALVARAHELGLAVNVWTVDDPDEIVALAQLGVDGVVTNVPDVAAGVLASR